MWFVRKWILRRVLKSALIFEREARGLYETLRDEIGDRAQGEIKHLVAEEEMHHRLLEDIVAGRVDDAELGRTLRGHRYHELRKTAPIDAATLKLVGDKLERALRDEEATVSFYANLERISHIRGAKGAFHLLADMEREHVEILKRLLGKELRS